MEKTLEAFEERRASAINTLCQLEWFLAEGVNAGIQVDVSLREKLSTAISEAELSKLKVALVGGFSEGKTSIAAAWMEQLDTSSMSISQQESSNEVDLRTDLVANQPVSPGWILSVASQARRTVAGAL